MAQTAFPTDKWTPAPAFLQSTDTNTAVLEPGEKELSDDQPWSDYPIAGQEDDMDEDERYFREEEGDDDAGGEGGDGDEDSDTDSDYDDAPDGDDDEKIDEDMDSDDENY